MARFRYRAVDASGVIQRGKLSADDLPRARTALRARGFLPLSVRAIKPGLGLSLSLTGLRRQGLSCPALALLTRQLATLISSGVRIEGALLAISRQAAPRMAQLCTDLRMAIVDGRSLAAAMSDHPAVFDGYFLASVRAGETAGRLGPVLTHLAGQVEAQQQNRQNIGLALIYPAILLLVSLSVVTALLVFVLPDIVKVFAARGADLPGLTIALISLSDGLIRWGPLAALGIVAAGIGAWQALKVPNVQMRWHRLIGRNRLSRQISTVQFAGTLATLTQSNVALSDALGSAGETVGNLAMRAILQEVTRAVRDGTSLSRALAAHWQFPPMMITIIASGEAGGSLPDTLGMFATDQSRALAAMVKTLVGLVEPLILMLMGGFVMALVLAILLPIINLNNLVG